MIIAFATDLGLHCPACKDWDDPRSVHEVQVGDLPTEPTHKCIKCEEVLPGVPPAGDARNVRR